MQVKVDFSELEKFRTTIGNAEVDKTIKDTLAEIAGQALRATKLRTPKDTGILRNAWQLSSFKTEGKNISIEMYNNAKYAMYVEYGHRQTVGRYVPAIGKRLVQPFVEGKYMMKKSVDELEQRISSIQEKHLYNFYKKIGYK